MTFGELRSFQWSTKGCATSAKYWTWRLGWRLCGVGRSCRRDSEGMLSGAGDLHIQAKTIGAEKLVRSPTKHQKSRNK